MSLADWTFQHQADLVASSLTLLYEGTNVSGWGLPELSDASVVLQHGDLPPLALTNVTLRDARTVVAQLPAQTPRGYYDVTLTIRERVTALEQTATKLGLPFGDVRAVVVALDPPPTSSRYFGDEVLMRLVEPVGRTLEALGVNRDRLQPTLLPSGGGGPVAPVELIEIAERVMRFRLPGRYDGYPVGGSNMHAINPGLASTVPLTLDLARLPFFPLLPLPLTEAQVRSVLDGVLAVAPIHPQLKPASNAAWTISAKAPEQLQVPAGMSSLVFDGVKRLLYHSGSTVSLECRLSYAPVDDGLGVPFAPAGTTHTMGPVNLNGLLQTVNFGLLRPRFVRHGVAAPGPSDGAAASVAVTARVTFNDAAVFSGTLPIQLTSSVVQLPLAVPSIAVMTDGKYEIDFQRPAGDMLVLAYGMGIGTLSTAASSAAATDARRMIAAALRLIDSALPPLRTAFPTLPFGDSVVPAGTGRKTAVGIVADWVDQAPSMIVLGHNEWANLSALGGTHPGYEDRASAAFLIGLPHLQRTLRVFSERSTDAAKSAYLEMRVPKGHLVASLWTLHETVFQGITPRTPFRAITEPSPKVQWQNAENDPARPNMPWWPTGSSFGNVISAYRWI